MTRSPMSLSGKLTLGSLLLFPMLVNAVPTSGPYTTMEALGEALFHDTNLSLNRTQSCATCHSAGAAFSDGRTTGVGGAVSLGDDGKTLGSRNSPTILYSLYSPPFHAVESGVYRGGQFHDGRARSLPNQVNLNGGPFLEHEGEQVLFLVAEDYTPVLLASRRWQLAFLLVTVFGVLAALLIQYHILQRGFAPMHKVRQELEDLSEGRLQQLSQHVPAEIAPLVDTSNRLLRVMEERLVRSRRAAGDLAHALKTPLSAFRILLESPEAASLPNRAALQQRLDEMQVRMNRELRRAQLMGGKAPGVRFRPDTDLPDLIQTLQQIYRHRALQIEPQYALQKPIAADREDMLELFGNLLDNACKWSTQRIRLEIESNNNGWRLCVADDGPGVDDSELPMLTQRGRRFDEQTAGNGLGLSIVHDIVEVYQGELSLDHDPELGGLRARILFPG
jgi:signal transduction histidine kinase